MGLCLRSGRWQPCGYQITRSSRSELSSYNSCNVEPQTGKEVAQRWDPPDQLTAQVLRVNLLLCVSYSDLPAVQPARNWPLLGARNRTLLWSRFDPDLSEAFSSSFGRSNGHKSGRTGDAADLVANTANGSNEGAIGAEVHLSAEVIHVDVDDVGHGFQVELPDFLNNRRARNGPPALKGGAVLALALTSVTVDGQDYAIQTSAPTMASKGKGKRTAAMVGGGAGI
jgi:hypothetical protein